MYDVKTKELYIYEYSYHYGIWNKKDKKEAYYFRFDREVLNKNLPRKEIEHFHVYFSDPHFDSEFINFEYVLRFIHRNWDSMKKEFYLDDITRT